MDGLKLIRGFSAALLICGTAPLAAWAGDMNLGRAASASEIAGWNIDVFPDGTGLPPGKGSVLQGKTIYQNQCLACHGAKMEGGMGPA